MFVNLRQRKGLTLVEMVVSVLILGLALGAMLGSFVIGRISATKAKHRIEAMNLLRAKMEEIKNTPYSNIVDEGPVTVTIDEEEGLRGTRVVDVDDDGYKEVEVVISWQDLSLGGTSQVSERLVTIVSR